VRDVKLGRNSRIMINALVATHLSQVRREIETAAANQHMAEFKEQCAREHALNRIRKALEMAS
jgi:hypothetical protein